MIEFKHAYKTFGADLHCLRDVSFSVNRGDFVFLIGPSGAGKTTLFKIISAYQKLSSGNVSVLGHDLAKLKTSQIPFLRRRLGFVLQNYKLLKNKTVSENIELPLIILGFEKDERRQQTLQLIDELELRHVQDQYPDFLSGGEQQRVAIARALIHNPEIILADEPTGNLDPALSKKVIALLSERAKQGTTVIVSTHDYRLLELKNSKVLQLEKGKLTEAAL